MPDGARLVVRTRQLGDRFKPRGLHGHSQKLSDTFVNDKVESHWRDRVPLLTINGEIAWFVFPNVPRSRSSQLFLPGNGLPIWYFSFERRSGGI